jgi:hypothetical protein
VGLSPEAIAWEIEGIALCPGLSTEDHFTFPLNATKDSHCTL